MGLLRKVIRTGYVHSTIVDGDTSGEEIQPQVEPEVESEVHSTNADGDTSGEEIGTEAA